MGQKRGENGIFTRVLDFQQLLSRPLQRFSWYGAHGYTGLILNILWRLHFTRILAQTIFQRRFTPEKGMILWSSCENRMSRKVFVPELWGQKQGKIACLPGFSPYNPSIKTFLTFSFHRMIRNCPFYLCAQYQEDRSSSLWEKQLKIGKPGKMAFLPRFCPHNSRTRTFLGMSFSQDDRTVILFTGVNNVRKIISVVFEKKTAENPKTGKNAIFTPVLPP